MRLSPTMWVAVSVLSIHPFNARANSVEDARRAYLDGRYETARSIAYPLAIEGNADAQFLMSEMLDQGKAREPNYIEAVRWLLSAAKQGHQWAQMSLGIHYNNGRGVPINYTEAVRWFRASSVQGNPISQSQLGLMYAVGHGVKRNYVIAYAWTSIAAADGRMAQPSELLETLEKTLSEAEITAAQRMANACYNSDYKYCNW